MSRLPLATPLGAAVAGALLVSSLAACSAILGIDENLVQGDADGSVGDGGGSRDDGGAAPLVDATTSDGPTAPDATPAADAGDAGPSVWHVDLDFADGGVYQALVPPNGDGVRPCALQLLGLPDAAPLIAGITSGQTLVVYSASGSAPLKYVSSGQDDRFGGALLPSPDRLYAQTVMSQGEVTTYEIDPFGPMHSSGDAGQTNLTFARFLEILPAGSAYHSIGSGGGVAADLYVNGGLAYGVALPANITASMTLAKAVLTANGTTYYGGICIGCNSSAVNASYGIVLPDGGAQGSIAIPSLATPGDGSGLTDLLAVGDDVYAVGFDDRAFVLVQLTPDGTAQALGSITAQPIDTDSFVVANGNQLDTETQLLGAFDGQQILVGGSFDGVKLAAFELDGGPAAGAFAETTQGDVTHSSLLDLTTYLPAQPADSPWYFQTMLLQGDYLYVTASTLAGTEGQWVVLRLVNSALDR